MSLKVNLLAALLILFVLGFTGIAQDNPDNDEGEYSEDENLENGEESDNGEEPEYVEEVTEEDWLMFEGTLFEFLNTFSEKYHVSIINSFDSQDIYVNVRLYKKLVKDNDKCNPDFIEIEDFLYTFLDNFGFRFENNDDIYVIKKQVKESITVTESIFVPKELEFRNMVGQISSLLDRKTDKIVYNEETRLIFYVGSQSTLELICRFSDQLDLALEEQKHEEKMHEEAEKPTEVPEEDPKIVPPPDYPKEAPKDVPPVVPPSEE